MRAYVDEVHRHVDAEVTLRGWLYNRRSSGKLHFLQVRDGTGTIQCVVFVKDVAPEVFEIAGRSCFREAHRNSKPRLLEPIMRIEVVTEASYLGDVIGDINRRRGQVTDQGSRGPQAFVQGYVPLAEMFGYINYLRSATSGRGTYTMEFDHYAEVPQGMVAKLLEKEAR